jgi:valyl-tRNA synthetase
MDRYQEKITNQMTRLGASLDWSRVAFTMDEVSGRQRRVCLRLTRRQRLSKAVIETFCLMHEKGMLYRANRLVNWCVYLNTSLSNLEVSADLSPLRDWLMVQVDQLALSGRTLLNVKGYDPKERFEFGVITSFAYPLENSGD